jgi:hypothetical protein
MTYDEVISKILDSKKDDWVNLTIANRVAISVNKQDVNLQIETAFVKGDEYFKAEWVNKFPNPQACTYFFHVRYGSSIIHEAYMVSVDTYMIPLPRDLKNLAVTMLDYKIALIHRDADQLKQGMEIAGITVQPEEM